MSRPRKKYLKEVTPPLMEKFNYSPVMQTPKVEEIVINIGVGGTVSNAENLDKAVEGSALITGQEPVIIEAKKSIARFRLREGTPIGAKVTLHGKKMYKFLDKLASASLPRVHDLHGINKRAFDDYENYILNTKEWLIFPEVDYDLVDRVCGVDTAIVTTANFDEELRELLT